MFLGIKEYFCLASKVPGNMEAILQDTVTTYEQAWTAYHQQTVVLVFHNAIIKPTWSRQDNIHVIFTKKLYSLNMENKTRSLEQARQLCEQFTVRSRA